MVVVWAVVLVMVVEMLGAMVLSSAVVKGVMVVVGMAVFGGVCCGLFVWIMLVGGGKGAKFECAPAAQQERIPAA